MPGVFIADQVLSWPGALIVRVLSAKHTLVCGSSRSHDVHYRLVPQRRD